MSENYDEFSDEELIERAKTGDREAFEVLFKRYEHRLQGFLRSQGIQEATVLDLAQETWLKAWKRINTYTPKKKFVSWLIRVAHNNLIDGGRKTIREQTSTGLDSVTHTRADRDAVSPELRAVNKETRMIVNNALEKLSPEQREAVVLHSLNGLTYQQTANEMGITEHVVRTLVTNGREKLEHLLPKILLEGLKKRDQQMVRKR